jgi:hypothetical protein
MLSTSAMSIEHAGHLFRFRQFAARDLYDADCIIEFGGGFGSMCRLVRALGFRGRYIVFDLPPVLALQRYFLGLNGIEATLDAPSNTWLCPDLSEIRTELARSRPNRVSLISTWALSEMPLAIRHEIEAFFALPAACMALLAYQPSFEGNDNHAWFHGLMERTGDRWRWNERPVDTVDRPPIPGDSLYVFGVAR